MYVGAGVGTVGVLGETGVTDIVGVGLGFLCLRWGLGRGLSDAFTGVNCETSSTLTLCAGLGVVVVAATRVVFAGGVAARAGVWWSTARATRNAAPNAARMQMMAVPANRTVK